jgi:parallel beta-helix repeat protein
VSGATVENANYFGIVNNGSTISVTNSTVKKIGESPFDGTQHGVGIYFAVDGKSRGTIKSNTVSAYQKNGIVVAGVGSSATISGNTVTGQGPVDYIAQNGIEVAYGATATVSDNIVRKNAYSGTNGASSTGILVIGGPGFGAGVSYTTGVSVSHNTVTNNDVGVYLYNAAANGTAPRTATKDSVVNNMIIDIHRTNISGNGNGTGYQAGIADFGNRDRIVNNIIRGAGYNPAKAPAGSVYTAIDHTGSTSPYIKNNK